MLINVRIIPNSRENCIDGVDSEGVVKIRIKSVPIDNRANIELCRFLSKIMGVPRSEVTIVRGLKNKNKLLKVPDFEGKLFLTKAGS